MAADNTEEKQGGRKGGLEVLAGHIRGEGEALADNPRQRRKRSKIERA